MARCEHTTRAGTPCPAPPLKGTSACSAHSGRLKGDPRAANAAGVAKRKAAREYAAQEAAIASLSLDERLRIAAAREGDALIAQLIKLAKDGDRQAIALVFDRVEGRSVQRVQTEQVTDTGDLSSLSMEELRRLAGPLRVLPGGKAADGMDTGIQPASGAK